MNFKEAYPQLMKYWDYKKNLINDGYKKNQIDIQKIRNFYNDFFYDEPFVNFLDEKTFPKIKPDNRRYLHDLISIRQDVGSDERVNAFSHMRGLFFNTL